MNYRMGIWGFLGSEELQASSRDGSTGNYGQRERAVAFNQFCFRPPLLKRLLAANVVSTPTRQRTNAKRSNGCRPTSHSLVSVLRDDKRVSRYLYHCDDCELELYNRWQSGSHDDMGPEFRRSLCILAPSFSAIVGAI